MGFTFKGYNGFPDLSTYNFINVGQNLTDIWGQNFSQEFLRTDLFRAIGGGSYLDFKNLVENPNMKSLMLTAVYSDPSTWIKMYDGIQLMQLSGSGTSWEFHLMFSKRDLVKWTVDTSQDPPETNHYEYGPQEIVLHCNTATQPFMPELFTPRMAILYFDRIVCPYDNYYLQDAAHDVYKIIIGNGTTVISTGSTSWDDAINGRGPIRRIVELDEHDYPTITERFDWPIGDGEIYSGDTPNDWWSYSAYNGAAAETFISSWGQVAMTPANDTSGPGGNDHIPYDDRSDPVPNDGPPTVGVNSSGFVKAYHVEQAELTALRTYLYSSSFLDNVAKMISNPMDYIISLMIFPLNPQESGSENIGIGGLDSGVSSHKILQYKEIDCGSVNVAEKYGGFMDYDNFTQVSVYLPFCGNLMLDTNIVMNSTLKLHYTIDFLTGDCVAKLTVKNNHGTNAQFYFKEGNCACQVPMSGANYANMYMGAIKGMLGIAGSAATGNAAGVVSSAVDMVSGMKVERERIGNISGNHGLMCNYIPYVCIERPVQSYAENYELTEGRPSNIGGTLGSFHGYTEVQKIKLDGVVATEAELAEIRNLLESGVYV